MRSLLVLLAFVCIRLTLNAQLDVNHFKKIQIGVMYDKTNVTGLYSLQDPNTNEMKVNLEDYRITTNAEIKYFVSSEKAVVMANLEGFAYIFGRLLYLAKQDGNYYDFDTYLDPLSAGECNNLKFISGDQINEVARLSNNHIFDFNGSWVIKESPVFAGINLSMRTLGFAPRYTVYKTEIPSGQYANSTMSATWKILYGLNVGYRTNLGSKAAFFIIGGGNRGLNKSKTDPDKSTAIQVKYNPFINPTIFIGGRFGMYVGLYWEMMEGRDADVRFMPTNANPNLPNPSDELISTKVNESQLLLKLGFYLSAKNE
ncbi:MAG: hypothetical protein IPQ03_07475 [Bacteroidetes bacterium]|nr:hypothetical protein [Bacteroidota bacterium]